MMAELTTINNVFNIMPNEYSITSTEWVSSGFAFLMLTAILLAIEFIVRSILFV